MRRISLTVLILALPLFCLAQDTTQSNDKSKNSEEAENLSAESIKQAVEKAIKETETEKEKNHAELVATLKSKLNLAVQEWVSSAKQNKKPELNKFLHQDWDLPIKVAFPIPFDYYLRDYNYLVTKADCFKSESLIAAYKAQIYIIEKLYIEGYHSSDASDKSQYYYTVTRPIKVSLDYQEDRFILTDCEYGQADIERGWKKK